VAIDDIIRFPGAPAQDPIDADLQEVLAAIGLVAGGAARRVRISGLRRPEAIAGVAIAHAQEVGVHFALEPNDSGGYTAMVGPLPG
jgi:hypothetical protein